MFKLKDILNESFPIREEDSMDIELALEYLSELEDAFDKYLKHISDPKIFPEYGEEMYSEYEKIKPGFLEFLDNQRGKLQGLQHGQK